MTLTDRDAFASTLFEDARKVLHDKGKDYAGDFDSLSNFKEEAEELNLTKYQIWEVYFNKQIRAIRSSIKHNPKSPQVESEPLRQRIIDVINYSAILAALLQDDEDESKKTIPF